MSKKTIIIIFVGVLIVLLVGSLLEKTLNETDQHSDFVENVGVKLSDEETAFIEKFYSDLNVIYTDVQSLDQLASFNNIPAQKQGGLRNARAMTYELLSAVCDSNFKNNQKKSFSDINTSMGTSSFKKYVYTRKWDRAFWSDLRYLYNQKYFAVVTNISAELPELDKGADSFNTGSIYSSIAIYDLTSLECVAHNRVLTENSDNIKFKRYTKVESQRKKLNDDLINQYANAVDREIKHLLDIK